MQDNRNILKNFTVLCVEDEPDVREELAQFLSRRVKALYLAGDGKEGLELFHQHKPDIVVTDILMPVMNGLDMAKEIKLLNPDTPIIITTAFNEADFFLRAIELGIDKYVLKPIKANKFVGSLQEIAWLLKAKKELKLSATVFNAASEGIIVTDAENKTVAVNPAFARITGYANEEVIGFNPKLLSSGRQDKTFYQTMWNDLSHKHHWQGEIWNRRKSGEIYPEWLDISVVTDTENQVIFHVAVFSDITARKEAEQKLYHLAHYDPLTELPNRTLLQDRLQQAILQAERSNDSTVALLFIDLDRFKYINDIYGHLTGDCLLQEVGKRLKASVRSTDTVSRIGGDEFVVLLTNLDCAQAASTVARHIVKGLTDPFVVQDKTLQIGGSIGISVYPDNGSDVDTLMRSADAAMYTVKDSGRNNFSFFQEEMNVRLSKKMVLENALQLAFKEEQFELYYQPLIDFESQQIEIVEALLCWHHPDGHLVSAKELQPLIEETGLVHPLSTWILRKALTQIKTLQADGFPQLKVAVSIVSKQLALPDFARHINHILSEQQFPAQCLELEITEQTLLTASPSSLEALKQLHESGIGIVINDFGFGYASLLHLNNLPIDRLVIDHSFVVNAQTDKSHLSVIGAIMAMAKSLSLKVTLGELGDTLLNQLGTHQKDSVKSFRSCPALPIDQLAERLQHAGH